MSFADPIFDMWSWLDAVIRVLIIVLIMTDGHENASREHTRGSVFDMITERRQQGWSFLFLGADQDSYASGQSMAMAPHNISNWEKSGDGTAKMWRDVSHSTSE